MHHVNTTLMFTVTVLDKVHLKDKLKKKKYQNYHDKTQSFPSNMLHLLAHTVV